MTYGQQQFNSLKNFTEDKTVKIRLLFASQNQPAAPEDKYKAE